MKILRLALFNIKKRKREACVIILLLAISMALLGTGIINYAKADRMFDEMFEQTGSYHYSMEIVTQYYKQEFGEIAAADERIERSDVITMLAPAISTAISYKKSNGELSGFYAHYITETNERKLENFVKKSSLSEEKIESMEHPIWLPYYVKYDLDFDEGDEFVFVISGKEYPFEIAGFYESGLFSSSTGYKCVVSDEDYSRLSGVVSEGTFIVFDVKDGVVSDYKDIQRLCKDMEERFNDVSGQQLSLSIDSFDNEKSASTMAIQIIMIIILFMAVVAALSCLFMIRHKITNDIDDQMESIGVLEALGYRSKEISRAYIYEYLVLSVFGVLLGAALTIATDSLMTKVLRVFIGHDHIVSGDMIILIIPAVTLTLLVILSALRKAGKIKKYPPVVAFRKGIKAHHFGKNRFAIAKSGKNINRRIGLKNLTGNTKQNVGVFFCIVAASMALTFCIFLCDIFRNRGAVFLRFSGFEKAIMVSFDKSADYESIRSEIEEMDEVRKCIPFRANNGFTLQENDLDIFQIFAYEDFNELENVIISEGRYPQHDNEVLIGIGMADKYGYSVGDSIVINYYGVEKKYIISGIINLVMNDGMLAYMTFEGFDRIVPPGEYIEYLFVYAKDESKEKQLKETIVDRYGSTGESAGEVDETDYEARIRAKADEQMAILMEKYGVDNASYSIKIGDKVISGNSEKYSLQDVSTIREEIDGNMGGISEASQLFSIVMMIVIAIVVLSVLRFLVGSTVRKEKSALGIEKAMGYTSKDLRRQMVYRIMPVAVPAVIVGTLLAVPVTMIFMKTAFLAVFGIRMFWVPAAIAGICLYVWLAAYIAAGKVKKISVTELMAE